MKKLLFIGIIIAGLLSIKAVTSKTSDIPKVKTFSAPTPVTTQQVASPSAISVADFNKMLLDRGEPSILYTPTPVPTTLNKLDDPDKIVRCDVDKNGSFEMKNSECYEMYKADPRAFVWKAYQNCVSGKDRQIGDKGTEAERKQPCADLFGIKLSN